MACCNNPAGGSLDNNPCEHRELPHMYLISLTHSRFTFNYTSWIIARLKASSCEVNQEAKLVCTPFLEVTGCHPFQQSPCKFLLYLETCPYKRTNRKCESLCLIGPDKFSSTTLLGFTISYLVLTVLLQSNTRLHRNDHCHYWLLFKKTICIFMNIFTHQLVPILKGNVGLNDTAQNSIVSLRWVCKEHILHQNGLKDFLESYTKYDI